MGVSLIPDRKGSTASFNLPWAAWAPLWIYVQLVTGDVLDEEDYQGGGSNDAHLISADKAHKLADVLDDRLARGIADDGDVRRAFRMDHGQRKAIQSWLDAGFEKFERAVAEGRELRADEIPGPEHVRSELAKGLPSLTEVWDDVDPAVSQRILRNFEQVVRGFSGFCRASSNLGGFRVC